MYVGCVYYMKYKHFLENFEILTHKFEPTRKSQVRISPEADIWNFCVGFYFNIFSLKFLGPGKFWEFLFAFCV